MDKSQSSLEPPQAWLWPQPNSSSPKALTSTSPAAAKTNSTTQSAKSAAMSPVYAATRAIRAILTSSSTRYVPDTAASMSSMSAQGLATSKSPSPRSEDSFDTVFGVNVRGALFTVQ